MSLASSYRSPSWLVTVSSIRWPTNDPAGRWPPISERTYVVVSSMYNLHPPQLIDNRAVANHRNGIQHYKKESSNLTTPITRHPSPPTSSVYTEDVAATRRLPGYVPCARRASHRWWTHSCRVRPPPAYTPMPDQLQNRLRAQHLTNNRTTTSVKESSSILAAALRITYPDYK